MSLLGFGDQLNEVLVGAERRLVQQNCFRSLKETKRALFWALFWGPLKRGHFTSPFGGGLKKGLKLSFEGF